MLMIAEKASALIRLALTDLRAVERLPQYKVDMEAWHEPRRGRCRVCLAGAVMARTLNVPADQIRYPFDFPHDIEVQLAALNKFRVGLVRSGCKLLSKDVPAEIPIFLKVPPYPADRSGFWAALLEIAKLLESHGL